MVSGSWKPNRSMQERAFLAFDLGAESGRAILGRLADGRLNLQEMSRFPNGMFYVLGHWRWNIYRLFEEMVKALRGCAESPGLPPESLGIDTWGVDFGLLGSEGNLIDLPVAYRDARTRGKMEEVFSLLPKERIYALTGNQFLPFNSLFQLFALRSQQPELLGSVRDLLFIPDLFVYLLTGRKATEFTYATTSQLYNPRTGSWEPELFRLLGVPLEVMQQLVPPGTELATIDPELADMTGIGQIPAVAVATHDTASAVAAVPAEGSDWAFISSGTWSLLGIETEQAIIQERSLKLNFTNEGGVGGKFRFLKNISGLWLLHACRREWNREKDYSYQELTEAASTASPFRSLIDPDFGEFLNPPHMPEAIAAFCRRSGQPQPKSFPAIVRCILESLALKYQVVLEQLRSLSSGSIRHLYMIGGGSRNALLCQFTADATGLPVTAGPAEATAVGNILMQALSRGAVQDIAEIRRIVRRSFPLKHYQPQDADAWKPVVKRFHDLLEGS